MGCAPPTIIGLHMKYRKLSRSKNKVTLYFDTEEEAVLAINARKYRDAVDDIWQQVFRPNFKHGYNKDINDLIDKCGTYPSSDFEGETEYHGADLISALADLYQEVIRELPEID